jgi:hypothetical protein
MPNVAVRAPAGKGPIVGALETHIDGTSRERSFQIEQQ